MDLARLPTRVWLHLARMQRREARQRLLITASVPQLGRCDPRRLTQRILKTKVNTTRNVSLPVPSHDGLT